MTYRVPAPLLLLPDPTLQVSGATLLRVGRVLAHYGMTDEALVPFHEELPKVRPALILSHHNERSAKASGFK